LSEQKIIDKLDVIIEAMKKKTGKNFDNLKPSFLERRVLFRMRTLEISNYEEYVQLISFDFDEAQLLYSAISINVTKFFRDPDVWDYLRDTAIPELICRPGMLSFSAWSCACASGEEPHSISILLNEVLAKKRMNYQVLATDISDLALNHSKEGLYVKANLVNVSQNQLNTYFDETPEGKFLVKSQIRNKISYQKGDMMKNSSGTFDIIFCRNVLIYYEKSSHQKLYEKFASSLKRNGLLVLGQDESMIGTEGHIFFELVDPKQRVYRKISK